MTITFSSREGGPKLEVPAAGEEICRRGVRVQLTALPAVPRTANKYLQDSQLEHLFRAAWGLKDNCQPRVSAKDRERDVYAEFLLARD